MKNFYRFLLGSISILTLFSTSFAQQDYTLEEVLLTRPSNCKVAPFPVVITQPDNSVITIIGKGNMNNYWTETTDGFSIVLKNGFYEYANKVNGDLVASGVRASEPSNRTASERMYLANKPISLKPDLNPLKASILNQVNAQLQNKTYPTTGAIKILALLIDYPNLQNTYPASNFDSLLYGSNYRNGDGSFKTFYETASHGQLTIDVDVRGWYRAANNYLYYGRDSGYDRAADLVREAVDAAETAGVDFSIYDNDNDNDVDGILVVHAGPGAESGSQTQFIWSHRWVMNGGNLGAVTYDGVFINDYMMNPETRGSISNPRMVGIGVFCHEFGHNLGLPDLYDTDNSNGDSEGIGNWGLMAGAGYLGGEHRPGNFCAWAKIENNWETPTIIPLLSSGTYTMNTASTTKDEIYQVNTPISSEYFLIENRQKTGLDLELPGEGLAIWHINTTKTNSSGNRVNGDEDLKGVDLEEADGNNDLDFEINRGDAGDVYPGTSNNTSFNNTSSPNSQNYSGGATLLQINNISTSGNTVTFDFGAAGVSCAGGVTSFNTPSGVFSDGSGNSNYSNNQNCSWLIQPSTIPTSITISFSAFATETTNDTVSIYAGTNASAPLVASYSGSAIPPATVVNGPDAFVSFKTNATFNDLGWDASYTSTTAPPTPCSGTTTLTSPSGTFSDGSGTSNYTNGLTCSWLIQPPGAATITFSLTSLATQINVDRIFVYDGASSAANQLGSYSGTNNLNTLTSTGGSMFVEFVTDATITDAGWDASYTSTTSSASCSGSTTLTALSGTFDDGSGTANYLNNRFCSWLIQPPSGTITLDFTAFATEAGADRVIIFDGTDNTAAQLANYSGNSIPASVTSTSNSMYLEFRTDGQNTDLGWSASYSNNATAAPTCSGTTNLTAASGTFNDGSGSNINYTNNLNCSWLISPSGVNNIRLITDSLALAVGDSVVVYDGANNTSPVLGIYKGSVLPPFVTSSGNDLFVEFHSDGMAVDSGFQMTYQTFTGCSGRQTLTAASGTFNDGTGAAQQYADMSNCSWLIQPNGATFIDLSFNRFSTENCCDVVEIFDGPTNTSPSLGSFRGNISAIPAVISSTGGSMLIVFSTDFSVTDLGWEATYTSSNTFCRANQNLTAASGSFSDGSGTSNYDNNTNCNWLITPPFSSSITLTFNNFDTESANDVVTVYDGFDNSGTILGTFSGSTVPPALTANGPAMYVEFNTNGTTTDLGWDATYSSVQTPSCSGTTTLTAASGTFEDGSSLLNYSDNLSCSWLISPTGSPAVITFNLSALDLADFGDVLRVYDGTGNGSTLIGSFFGNNLGNVVSAYSGDMFIEFTTNGTNTGQGWTANYNTSNTFCTPLTTLTGTNGNFTDGSPFGSNYADNSDCSWLIQPASPNLAISLNFFQFDTEAGNDTVTIYDGPTTASPIIQTISGSNPTIPISISSGGSMLVTFKSNGSTSSTGWRASYQTQQIPYCNGATTVLTAANGTFDDGSPSAQNYIQNSDCSWLIQPSGASLVSLSFNRFDTQAGFDNVTVYDGPNASSPVIGNYSGNTIPSTILSSGNSLFLTFQTNGFFNLNGWEASYVSTTSQCFPTATLTAFTDTIRDGSGTGNYGNNLSCNWLIQPPTATTITFDFFNFDLAAGDSVFIYDGTSNTANRIGAYSGNNLPSSTTTTGGDMFIEFITDATGSTAGWEGVYTITSSQSCFGQTRLTAVSGTFEDGSGTGNYTSNLNCEWLIQPTGNPAVITFNMNAINLANFGDRVRVYDGTTTGSPLIGSFFGTNLGNILSAYSGSMLVVFETDNFITSSGWNASYSSSSVYCTPLTTFTALNGNFTDGSPFNGNYLDNSDCAWLIAPAVANQAVVLRFFQFDTELNNDTVTIYDGSSTTDPILATYSGSNIPATISSSGNRMLVTFKSNGSTTAGGWRANYFTQQIPFCSGTTNLVATQGNFDDGSAATQQYLQNSNCSWLIQPPGASIISLSFNRFSTQVNFDTLTIYDGASTNAPILGTFSGSNLPPTLLSSGGDMLVTFKTNGFTNDLGWEATYNSSTSQCFNNLSVTSFSDTIEDGSGNLDYGNNLNCSWLIQPPTATSITFNFLNFDVAANDSIFIYDGTTNSANRIGAFSGNALPVSVSSTGGNMFIEFVTDGTTTAAGWRGFYTITSSLSCFGRTLLTAPSGNFEDGSGLGVYDDNLSCEWLIQPNGNPTVITLQMNSMALGNFGDRVRVYDGTTTSAPLVGSFFGTNTGNIVSALSGSMLVVFETDNFISGQGWDATYNSSSTYCTPGNLLTTNFGNFTDGSPFGTNYLDNSDCSWLIQPATPNQGIQLRFFQFATELNNDTVTLYDGATTSDPILGTFSGSNIPPITLSTGTSMLVTFKTNGSNTASGWRANYSTFQLPTCSGLTTLTAANGVFDDGSTNGINYSANSMCSWLIQPPGAISVDLTWNYFSTQLGQDVVSVYNGTNNSAPSLGTFSGNTLPPAITASSGSVFIEFTSNNFFEDNGFEVSYTSSNTVIIDASPDTIFINAAAGSTGNFALNSNTNWTSSDNATWLIVSPVNGTGNQTLNALAIQPNIGPDRSALAFITSAIGNVRDTVVVIQRGSGNFMTANPDTLFFDAVPAGSQNLTISSNVNWNLNSPSTWISFNPTSGANNGTSAVTVSNNPSNSIRTGFIAVGGNLGVSNDTVFIVQRAPIAPPPSLSVDPSTLSLTQAAGSNGSFTVNSTVVWQTAAGDPWLTITNPANTIDTGIVQISANTANITGVIRNSFVAVQDAGGTLFDTVFVSQAANALTLSLNPRNITVAQPTGSSGSSSLISNTTWVQDGSSAWINSSNFSGTGNEPITLVTTSPNNTTADREGFVAFKDVTSIIFDTLFVTQTGLTPNLSVNPSTLTLAQPVNSFDTFTVNSNVDWQVVAGATWLTVNPPATTNDTGKVEIIANSMNMGSAPRDSYVAVSDLNGTLFDTVFVSQLGSNPSLTANPDTIRLNAAANSNDLINITSNVSWAAITPASWLDITPTSGFTSGIITATANSDNNTGSIRSSFVAIENVQGAPSNIFDTVVVIQDTFPTILSTNPDTIRISSGVASSGSFTVSAPPGLSWNSTPDAAWISLSQSTGVGSATVNVLSVTANTGLSERITFIETVDNSFVPVRDTVYVIQETIAPALTVNPGSLNLGSAAGSNDILTVSSNVSWTITNPVTWLTVNPSFGVNNATITVTANSANVSGSARTAALSFDGDGGITQTVSITQIDGSTPTFEVSVDTVFIDNPQGSTGLFSVLSNVNDWELIENTSWLLLNPSKGSNVEQITALVASRNVNGNTRYATVTAKAVNFSDKLVVIAQRGATPLLNLAPSMVILGPDSSDFFDFNISSNLIAWTVSETATWMEVSPTAGAFTQQVRVTAIEDNEVPSQRSDIITVTAPPMVPQTIMVTQDTIRKVGLEKLSFEAGTNLYPNPTRGNVTIDLASAVNGNEVEFTLLNILGEQIPLNFELRSKEKVVLTLSGMTEGIYFLRMNFNGKLLTKKISFLE